MELLRKRRIELVNLVAAFEHKPNNEPFIEVVKGQVAEMIS